MERTYSHYSLTDPRVDDPILRVRYIGRTMQPLNLRLYFHIWKAQNGGHTWRERWIRKVLEAGLKPEMIDLGPGGEDREAALIIEWRTRGARLTNMTAGGDGLVEVQLTPEAKERKRRIQRELLARPDIRAKIYSPENQKKRAEDFERRKQEPEFLQKMRDGIRQARTDPKLAAEYAERLRRVALDPVYKERRRQTFIEGYRAKREQDPICQQVREMILQGMTKVAIAQALGLSYKQIVNREIKMRRDGMMPPSPKRGRAEKDLLWQPTRDLLAQGYSAYAVAQQLGLPHSTVDRRVRRMKKEGLL
jgi:hypothetical protein